MNSIIFLLVLLISITLLHLAFLTRTYVRFSIPWLLPDSDNSNYPKFNTSTHRLRTVISLAFFFSPLFLFKAYKNLPVENITIDIIVLVILSCLTCFLLYINKYKIWSKSFRTVPNKKSKTDLMLNSIEGTLKNHANAINQNSETMSCLDKELLKTKIEFKSKLTKITLKTQNNHLNTVKNTSEIEKNIQSLKKNTFTKPRNSKKREQKISTIEKGFKLFITELENFPNYNSEEKIIDYKKYELSELQAYQTLIEFFRKNYEVPLDQTYSIMFGIFNLHFNIKGKELKSNNWDDFKKRLLPDIENNTLISDLYLNIKK